MMKSMETAEMKARRAALALRERNQTLKNLMTSQNLGRLAKVDRLNQSKKRSLHNQLHLRILSYLKRQLLVFSE